MWNEIFHERIIIHTIETTLNNYKKSTIFTTLTEKVQSKTKLKSTDFPQQTNFSRPIYGVGEETPWPKTLLAFNRRQKYVTDNFHVFPAATGVSHRRTEVRAARPTPQRTNHIARPAHSRKRAGLSITHSDTLLPDTPEHVTFTRTPSDSDEKNGISTMSYDNITSEEVNKQEPAKLKFGVDRILSEDEVKTTRPSVVQHSKSTTNFSILSLIKDARLSKDECQQSQPIKPKPSVAHTAPCSECVTSLFRCCRLSPSSSSSAGSCRTDQESGGVQVMLPNVGLPYGLARLAPFSESLPLSYGIHIPSAVRHLTIRQIPSEFYFSCT